MFELLSQKFSSIFSRIKGGKITQGDIDHVLDQVKQALLEADVPYSLVTTFIGELQQDVLGQKLAASMKPAEQLLSIVHNRLITFFGGKEVKPFTFAIPSTIMVLGLQGSGKTTSIAKMAVKAQEQASQKNKKVSILLASVDFYRPAAVDQLEQLAKKAGMHFYRAQSTDPVAAVREIISYKEQGKYDLLFLDTAGRMHIDSRMLQELQDITHVLSPTHRLLVLDAMTGQESLNVAKAFGQAVGFDAAVLTKMDSDTRGGAAFSFCYGLKKPIAFLGTGEKKEDLSYFYPDRIADRILDRGDMQSLLEKAQEKIRDDEQKRVEESFKSGRFTLEDFASQMAMMSRLGSLTQLMKYLPGMGGVQLPQEKLESAEQEMKKFKVILSSMTRKERLRPEILDGSRRQRIARGAGVTVAEVNTLLRRFEEAQQYVKLMKKMGPFKGMFR